MQLVAFSLIMSIILVQWCVSFWANRWNTSHWVKYVNILGFSGTYFPTYVPGFFSNPEIFWLEKTFIFAYHMQCLSESMGKLKYNIHLCCTWKILSMMCQTSSTDTFQCIFFLHPLATVYIFGNVTIHLLNINTEST